jgi:proteasome lid subunit RPN8/RPN11
VRAFLARDQQIDRVSASMRGEWPTASYASHPVTDILFSQYHRRLYTLDSQIHHLQAASKQRLGAWLARRYAECENRHRAATQALAECGYPLNVLRDEYKKQVETQTRPLPSRAFHT